MSNELVTQRTMSSTAAAALDNVRVLEATLDVMARLVAGGCLPKGMTGGEGMLCAAIGQRFGWNALESCQRFHVVKGSLVMKADTMVAVAKAHPDCEYIAVIETSTTVATYETKRRGTPTPERVTFTIEDARAAGLLGGNSKTWKQFPAQMLRARASSGLVRMVYPDALAGIYTADEMGAPEVEMGITPTHDPDIIDATYTPTPQRPASAKPAQVEHVAEPHDTLMGFIEAHDLTVALELYMAAKSPKGAECGLTVDTYKSLPKSAADSALNIMREVYGDGDVNAMWAGAQVSMTAALDRECTKADTDALATRIATVNENGADRRAQVIAAALLADHCVRNPAAVHLRLGLPKVGAEKGGEA